jgi:Chaperone of endosialidase
MKKFTLTLVLCSLILSGNLTAQIKVNTSGYVGINNTNPAYRLDVNGDMKLVTSGGKNFFMSGSSFYANPSYNADLGSTSYMWYRIYSTYAYFTYNPVIGSDSKIKSNIKDLTTVKDKIKLLRPVTYNLKSDITELQIDKTNNGLQYGFIAEELQSVFPEMVTTWGNNLLGIRYTELIPVLVQAIKDQQTEIDALTKRVSDLESKIK